MDKLDETWVVSATDLVANLACQHVTWLDRLAADGTITKPVRNDEMLQLLRNRGLDHEKAYLASLRSHGLQVADIEEAEPAEEPPPERSAEPAGRQAARLADLRRRTADTREAMASGIDVVYQGTFLEESAIPWWRGHADFLRRVEAPSALGDWSYEPEDTKLARHITAGAALQLAFYAEQVERAQGTPVRDVWVVMGGRDRQRIRLAEIAAYYRTVRRRFIDSIDAPETYPLPNGHCRVCRWAGRCHGRWEADDHLSRVAFITGENTKCLEAAGITTLTALATAPEPLVVDGLAPAVAERLRTQASLQLRRPADGPPLHLPVLPIEKGMGLAALPEPDPGDLFYDIEGHSYVGEFGLEYLHGIGSSDDGTFTFEGWWAHNELEEREVFERLIDRIVERRHQYPGMHVYHYAPYETTAIGKLMGRYGTREDEVDDLLRNRVFVDLYRVVRQGVRVGVPSYSIKKLEPLYALDRTEDEIGSGGSSVVEYERWLQTQDQTILNAIEEYNRLDVESTLMLRNWLEEVRQDVIDSGEDVPRPEQPDVEESEALDSDLAALIDTLTADRDDVLEHCATEDTDPPELDRARWLMADLLQFHRREDKPDWWRYFARRDTYDDADFIDDAETVGGLSLVGEVDKIKRSTVWRYEFDPGQEIKLRAGDATLDPARLRRKDAGEEISASAGEVVAIDVAAGTIDLKRGNSWQPPHPTALMVKKTVDAKELRQSLQRVAYAMLDHGIDSAGPARAARQLLARRHPTVAGHDGGPLRHDGEETADAAIRLVRALDHSYLAIQGPPGAGKTYTAAKVILDQVEQGNPVGVTAFTHSAIGNLLREVIKQANEAGRTLKIVQKVTDHAQGVDHPFVSVKKDATAVAKTVTDPDAEIDIVAGTAWQFARDDMQGTIHTLFVDEAGQLSLANVVAIAPAARNLILVGDPQQLAQPSKGVHPPGAGVSALEHILDGDDTMPPDLGLFLDQTWRMHPRICEFISEQVYEGRLHSKPDAGRQVVADGPIASGSGLRFVPVTHERNRTSSVEEAHAVRDLYQALIGRQWTKDDGKPATIDAEQILVVAPYNAQVHELAAVLPSDARVGTVDRFQGQEAAVVLVSLAASTTEDVPRGMEFLYSRNRLNVAVSRAKALCVMVASPELLAVECRTVDQMRLANVLCRYAELAKHVPLL